MDTELQVQKLEGSKQDEPKAAYAKTYCNSHGKKLRKKDTILKTAKIKQQAIYKVKLHRAFSSFLRSNFIGQKVVAVKIKLMKERNLKCRILYI